MNRKKFIATIAVAIFSVGTFCFNASAKASPTNPSKPQSPQQNEDIVLACKASASREIRMAAINRIAELDDWQSLSRILVFVTKRHDDQLAQLKKSNPNSIVRNENNILNLGIDEFVILKSLARIGNPGAIPYILAFRRIRSNQGNLRSGQYWAVIDKTTKDLREKMLDWDPENESDKKKL